ncbi:MAG: zinc ribbon domain-containing protein [Acidobacteriota bacterium]
MERKIILTLLWVGGAVLSVIWTVLILSYVYRQFPFRAAHDQNLGALIPLMLVSIILVAVLTAWLGLCLYVYRDSDRRGMNQLLWTLVSIFTPNLLGFVIYLILRKPLLQQCAQCGQKVDPSFVHCIYCGAMLKSRCASCQAVLKSGQKYCGGCGTAVRAA